MKKSPVKVKKKKEKKLTICEKTAAFLVKY